MRVLGIVCARNEAPYLKVFIEYYRSNNIDLIFIDNDSTDTSRKIMEGYLGKGVIEVRRLPYDGCFDLISALDLKERIIASNKYDWYMHIDADEIMEAPDKLELNTAISEEAAKGYNAIRFREFTFIPANGGDYKFKDYLKTMKHYYHYNRNPLVRAFNPCGHKAMLSQTGGHKPLFPGLKISPREYYLRHYIALSQEHLEEKYGKKWGNVAPRAVQRDFHGFRKRPIPKEKLKVPGVDHPNVRDISHGFIATPSVRNHLFLVG